MCVRVRVCVCVCVCGLCRILEIVAEADRNKPPKELNRRFIIVEVSLSLSQTQTQTHTHTHTSTRTCACVRPLVRSRSHSYTPARVCPLSRLLSFSLSRSRALSLFLSLSFFLSPFRPPFSSHFHSLVYERSRARALLQFHSLHTNTCKLTHTNKPLIHCEDVSGVSENEKTTQGLYQNTGMV